MNDEDPSHSLPNDQCVLCQNVEFFYSTLGERRKGTNRVNLAGSDLDTEQVIVHIGTYLPKQAEVKDTELFVVSATLDSATKTAHRGPEPTYTWNPVSLKDAIDPTDPTVLRIQSQTLHGKWFVAYKSAVDRMHVSDDGVNIRRTGLARPPAAPVVIDTATPGVYLLDRIFRVRYTVMDGTVILRQSEPSDETAFTPNGVDDGAIISRPPLVNEGETNWVLEASDGDGNFYAMQTLPIATLTATDHTQPATDYANLGVLSADIEDYDNIPSVKFVKADQDRLIFGGSWEDPEKGSRVSWTPVWADPGFGNDERIPLRTDNFLDLDWMDGGDLTGLSDPLNGAFYAFKWSKIYKLQRTGNVNAAYQAVVLSSSNGAVPGSIVSGMDEFGRGCVYFLDPSAGPSRISTSGLQRMKNIRASWRRVNTSATEIISHGVYYPDKQQVHWWVAVDGGNTPTFKLVSQVDQITSSQTTQSSTTNGTNRGWVVSDGLSATAWCSAIVPEPVTRDDGSVQLVFRPYSGHTTPSFIQRCDQGSTDDGTVYKAKIVTKPYILAGLLNRWAGMTAALLAPALADPSITLNISFVKDFGLDENTIQTNFTPVADEPLVIRVFDNLRMSEAKAIQIIFEDPDPDVTIPVTI